jgi:predicted NBD/HSP70 family sugar kinase
VTVVVCRGGWVNLEEELMSQLFAGIDWGGTHHQMAVVDSHGREVWNRRFAHDREGVDGLIASLTV